MTGFQVDANGSRIKTDILTSGYLRQDIEKKFKILIPTEIKGLCFEYWFIKICDEWDKSYHAENPDVVQFDGPIAINKSTSFIYYVTLYGLHVAESGEYEWTVNVRLAGAADFCIGVIEDKDEYLKKHHQNVNYDLHGYGCWWYPDGSVSAQDHTTREAVTKSFADDDGNLVMNDAIIGMKINMETKKISYSIDGNDYIEAPITLKKDKYRLAVTLFHYDDQIELL